MANLITNVSKYLMILLIAIYTYYNFRFFGIRDEWGETASVPSPECGDGVNPHSCVPYYLPAHRG